MLENKEETKKYKCYGYVPNAIGDNECTYLGEYSLPDKDFKDHETRKYVFYKLGMGLVKFRK